MRLILALSLFTAASANTCTPQPEPLPDRPGSVGDCEAVIGLAGAPSGITFPGHSFYCQSTTRNNVAEEAFVLYSESFQHLNWRDATNTSAVSIPTGEPEVWFDDAVTAWLDAAAPTLSIGQLSASGSEERALQAASYQSDLLIDDGVSSFFAGVDNTGEAGRFGSADGIGAVTIVTTSPDNVETDIVVLSEVVDVSGNRLFNLWCPERPDPNIGVVSVQDVIWHELGHAMGVGHVIVTPSTPEREHHLMHERITAGEIIDADPSTPELDLSAGEIEALQFLYDGVNSAVPPP